MPLSGIPVSDPRRREARGARRYNTPSATPALCARRRSIRVDAHREMDTSHSMPAAKRAGFSRPKMLRAGRGQCHTNSRRHATPARRDSWERSPLGDPSLPHNIPADARLASFAAGAHHHARSAERCSHAISFLTRPEISVTFNCVRALCLRDRSHFDGRFPRWQLHPPRQNRLPCQSTNSALEFWRDVRCECGCFVGQCQLLANE